MRIGRELGDLGGRLHRLHLLRQDSDNRLDGSLLLWSNISRARWAVGELSAWTSFIKIAGNQILPSVYTGAVSA